MIAPAHTAGMHPFFKMVDLTSLFGIIAIKATKTLIDKRKSAIITVASTHFVIFGVPLKVNKYYSSRGPRLRNLPIGSRAVNITDKKLYTKTLMCSSCGDYVSAERF